MRQVLLPAKNLHNGVRLLVIIQKWELRLTGLRLIEADDTHHEADIIACLMRETLKHLRRQQCLLPLTDNWPARLGLHC